MMNLLSTRFMSTQLSATRQLKALSFLGCLAALSACGGGGSSASAPPPPTGGPPGDPPAAQKFAVGGTVSGLSRTVVISNGGEDLSIDANRAFQFTTTVATGGTYNVTVKTHPSFPAQDCTVGNGTGVIGTAAVTNVAITCTDLPVAVAQADAGPHQVTISWSAPSQGTSFKIHVAKQKNCDTDINSNAFCIDASLLNATSPFTFVELDNAQPYFFQVETTYPNGARGLAAEVSARPNAVAFDGRVTAIAPTADGSVVYLGGIFTQAGVSTGSAVPLDASSGRLASPDFPMVDGTLTKVITDGVGGWYIGGVFSTVGGVARANVAHILADGSVDPNWNAAVDGIVYALLLSGDTVYVGGDFTSVGTGTTRHNLAAFNVTNGSIEAWDPNANGKVGILVRAGNAIYAGGRFGAVGGITRANLAAIDADTGVVLPDWSAELTGGAEVSALAVSDDANTVYVGGDFTQVHGEDLAYLAAFDTVQAGGTGDPTSWNPRPDHDVTEIAVFGNTVYVGGIFQRFTDAGGNDTQRFYLAALDATTATVIEKWRPQPNAVGGIALAVSEDGKTIYVGGTFGRIGNQERRHLAAIDADGTLKAWNPSANSAANSLAVAGDVVYAVGDFTSVGPTVKRNGLAAVDASGALTDWAPGVGNGGAVLALALSKVGTVYVGGHFNRIGDNLPRSNLAEVDAQGTPTPWAPAVNDQVMALAVSDMGDTVFAAGSFDSVGGVSSQKLVALNATSGEVQAGWVDPALAGTAVAIVTDDDRLYVAGTIAANVGGVPRDGPFAFDAATGQLDEDWSPGIFGPTSALAVSNHVIYVGGQFNEVNRGPSSLLRRNLAAFPGRALLGSGIVTALPWDPSVTGPASRVTTLALRGRTIYAGGWFDSANTTANGLARQNLAAFETVGLDETGLGTALPWKSDTFGQVHALAVTGNTLYVGGDLVSLGGNARGAFGAVNTETEVVLP